MGRPRAFDWDEAQRLRAQGLPYQTIADRLGTSANSVACACDPDFRHRQRKSQAKILYSAVCPDCGGPRNRYHPRCAKCDWAARATTVRGDGTLRCMGCREWKPATAFSMNRGNGLVMRGGRRRYCRACDTAKRRAYRARKRREVAA